MPYDSGPRVGFVRIKARATAGTSFPVLGLPVLGRSRGGFMSNRAVYVDPQGPAWFLDFSREHANTKTKVRVKVSRLLGLGTAFVVPCADSLEELNAVPEEHVHYGTPDVYTDAQLSKAFEFHQEVADHQGLEVVEHVQAGKASYSIARDVRSLAKFKISGGYFCAIAAEQHQGDGAKITADRKHLVRVRPIQDESLV
jgi:hypothetical protein